MCLILFEQVSKSFDHKKVLKNINLEIYEGEFLVLLGPSGSGKTTLLKHINVLLRPDSGNLIYKNQLVDSLVAHKFRRKIGYVIQDVGLMPHLTVAQNINLPRKIDHIATKDVSDLLAQVQLPADLGARYPHQLSGGQQQRVGIARALANDPELILMDEPFSSLDNITRKQLQHDLLNLKKQTRSTIVMVTHDIQEAFSLGDRIAIMNQGEISQVGKPENLLLHPQNNFIKQFLQNDQLILMLKTILLSRLGFEALTDQSVLEALTNRNIESPSRTDILKKFFNMIYE